MKILVGARHQAYAFDGERSGKILHAGPRSEIEDVRVDAAGPPPIVEATPRMLWLEGRRTSGPMHYDRSS